MPWILERPCDLWLWDVPKIQTLAAQPCTAWALADFSFFEIRAESECCFWLDTVENTDSHSTTRKCAGTRTLQCFRIEKCPSKKAHNHAQQLFIFRLAMILTMYARRFPKTHPWSGTGSSPNASKDVGICAHLWIRNGDGRSVCCSWLSSHSSRT